MKGTAILVLPGALFGIGLAVSGMTDPTKVIGFLDVTGRWDPSLALVMVGALSSFAVLNALIARRDKPVLGGQLPGRPSAAIDGRLIAGAALFGIGWGLGGLCPGPAIANLGGLYGQAALFVVAMVAGMTIAQRLLGADRSS